MTKQKGRRLTSTKLTSEQRVRGRATAPDVAPQADIAHRKLGLVILSSLGIAASFVSIIIAYHLMTSLPELVASAANPSDTASLPFVIENKNKLFSMREASLICKLDRGVFASEDGSQLITPSNPSQRRPIIAEQDGVTIDPAQHVEFRCNETEAIRNPRFSEQFKFFQSAEVHVEITYKAWPLTFWKNEYVSPKFRRSKATGFHWVTDEVK